MRQEGLISDHHWSELLFIFARIGERQAMQAAWQDWREAYGDEFRGFMDQYLTGPMRSSVSLAVNRWHKGSFAYILVGTCVAK